VSYRRKKELSTTTVANEELADANNEETIITGVKFIFW